MAVREITVDQFPKGRRTRVSPIKETQDWKDTMDKIVTGGWEALMVEFAAETLALGKATPDRFKRLLAAEIRLMKHSANIRLTFRGKSAKTRAPILYIVRIDKMKPGPEKSDLEKEKIKLTKKELRNSDESAHINRNYEEIVEEPAEGAPLEYRIAETENVRDVKARTSPDKIPG